MDALSKIACNFVYVTSQSNMIWAIRIYKATKLQPDHCCMQLHYIELMLPHGQHCIEFQRTLALFKTLDGRQCHRGFAPACQWQGSWHKKISQTTPQCSCLQHVIRHHACQQASQFEVTGGWQVDDSFTNSAKRNVPLAVCLSSPAFRRFSIRSIPSPQSTSFIRKGSISKKRFDRSQLDVPNQRFRMLNLHSHTTPGLILRLPEDSEISGYGLSDLLAWAAKAFDGLQYPKPWTLKQRRKSVVVWFRFHASGTVLLLCAYFCKPNPFS